MKKDKSHGQDEADCRAKLILINGDNAPGVVLEANGKPSTQGEHHHAVPRVLPGCARMPRVGDLTASVPGSCWGMKPCGYGQSPSMTPLDFCNPVAHPGHGMVVEMGATLGCWLCPSIV